jgi:hypothetical protein
MKTPLAILFVLASISLFVHDINGDLETTLKVNGGELRLALHTGDSSLKATIDSLDQEVNGIPVSSTMLKSSKLSLKLEVPGPTETASEKRERKLRVF